MQHAKITGNRYSVVRRLAFDQHGSTGILAALGVTALMGFAGLGVDVGYWQLTQHRIQDAADQAAFAAANASNGGTSATVATTLAKGVTRAVGFADGVNNVTVAVNNPPLSGSHTTDNSAWEVVIQQPQPMWFASLVVATAPTVTARSVAIPTGGSACAIALKTTGQDTFLASGSATPDFSNCDIVVNSSDVKALEATGGSSITAKDAYIVGNYNGNLTVSDKLKTGITPVPDPYAGRTAPTVGACGANPTSSSGGGFNGNYTSPSAATTIYPGVYCGDITAGGPLTLSPGVYIIKGGNFKDQGGHGTLSSGVCTGTGSYVNATGGVTIYMVANGSNTGNIQVSSCLAITAPSSGNTAGLAFWVDQNQKVGDKDAFSGGSIMAVTGTIYAPVHEVDYTGSSTATTGCTQLVSYIIKFTGTANFSHGCAGTGVSDPLTNAKLAE